MKGDLKVVYLLDDIEIKQYMTQQQLAELLKDAEVLLLSVNDSEIKRYQKKKK